MSQKIINLVTELVLPIIEEHEFELSAVEYEKMGQDYILRILIDKPGGITLNDTADISEEIAPLLDQIKPDPFPEHYMLEVASPGVEKPINKAADWESALNQYIHVSLYQAIEGAKIFEGDLIENNDEKIVLSYLDKTRTKTVTIPKKLISKARLAIKF
ncbi:MULTISPECIES: ribosome maturation factor RimP [unclassified Enterococcus]|uniref:ribosome maturation factor RimP n=1 Tax=unclassified Enterococcus TaxID=2608891 RepID=UPI001554F7CA|nr:MULTISPECIES: ribosome maturation factor RimP [unclassified Enterococcus]MBS7576631.1 ribosome maturation factor RimP [Enterococcus sp. MMGLQ5-2]MBS7583882.1 ribosome maturation factor RimP [Enterococcus sp. MMGLQ5-1]NPD11743.1 ribosome maturation factor RimP [Enterococcus sp. MMGLQ5-1]NPD36468.1 ribosome maturation factor RimP [Enterococcus sp. MMGLQ5-2]